jgi:Ca2+-binding RTX toxin-like protein
VSFDFTLADITLLDFSVQPDCDPPPPRLGGVTDKTLVVFAGKFGNGSVRGHSAWSNTGDGYKEDVVKVTQLHKYTKNEDGSTTVAKSGVKVDMLGITETWEGDYDRVVIDGRGYGRPMKVTLLGDGDQSKVSKAAEVVPTGGFTMEAVVLGGDVDDTIKSGNGRSLIAGGTGNDSISASDQPASGRVTYLAGGGGDDAVTSGNANAIAAGDSDLTGGNGYETFSSTEVTHADGSKQTLGDVVDWTKLAAPRATEAGSDGKDRVAVGLGVNTSYGNGRDDSVGVAADSELAKTRPAAEQAQWKAKANTIVLGSGSDVAKGGSAADTIWTGAHTAQTRADADVDGTGGADSGVRNTVDTGTGNDTVFGSTIPDNVTGGSKATEKDVFTGGSGNDALLGGFGTDELFGGPGEDWVVAEPAQLGEAGASGTFGVARSYTKTPLPTGAVPSSKLLVGGDGADHVVGGDGGARIFGDRYEATDCLSGAAAGEPASTPPGEPTAGTAGRDLILGGTGVDEVKAGGEADRVEAYAGDDLLCGQDGDDEIYAAAGADKVWAGSGKDRAYGDDGADNVFGNAGNDQLFGGGGADDIEGNADSDTVYGGAANDTILGGTRAAALADEGDTLYGDVGADRIIGDNGDGMWPHDLAATNTAHGGPDSIFGGDDDDVAFGGLDADAVNGGGQNDHLEGNHAKDVVHGDGGEDQVVGGGQEIATAGPPKGGRPDDDDQLFGDGGNDLLAGDNAILTVGELVPTPLIADRGFVLGHGVQLLDLHTSAAGTFGDDDIRGGAGNDVLLGQSGEDDLFGEAGDDYAEGNQGKDAIAGGDNEDDLVGGSSTEAGIASGQPDTDDVISGGADGDVVLGDNGLVLRSGTPHPLTVGRGIDSRSISLLDLGDAPTAGTSGGDLVTGDGGNDVVLGQDGPDRLKGNADDDYLEGGQAADWLEGGAADDDLVGGGYTTHPANRSGDTAAGQVDVADVVFGGPGDDVATGDNAQVLRTGVRTKATDRIGTRQAGTRMVARQVTLLDLTTTTGVYTSPSARPVYGADQVSGGDGVDVAWGQDGDDSMSGGAHDDYLQGNGGGDLLRGDAELTAGGHFAAVPPAVIPGLPGAAGDAAERLGVSAPDGQDDLIGGSAAAAFRDGADKIQGDGESDVELGDNGSLVRTLDGAVGSLVERVYSERYPANAVPANATKMRTADGPPTASTRFCVPLPRVTCDVAGTFGNDVMYGDAGDDGMWGQDGDDTMRGGSDRDDMFGELGADVIFGDDGEDAILGDRGGVRNEYLNTDVNRVNVTLNPVPMESYSARAAGRYDRRVDLLHDTNGNLWSGTSTSAAMPHPGLLEGGNDRIRGGAGDDQIHAGWGEDLANGDSGGDEVFGGDGADVLWGGKGCAGAECVGGDAAYRGVGDKFVDHIFGGRGGASEAVGVLGSDILDWAPRPGACTANPWPLDLPNGTSQDPCAWFQMTSTDDGDVTNNQHHHGTDWIYGGWDRDVMQGDVAANGPNPGDRLMDWNGTYNLFTHCNAAYGGFNDIRQHSPSMNTFLQGLAYGAGAGRSLADLTTASTSAFRELALSYAEDTKQHAAGKAFPGTPGHFDQPVACAP